MSLTTVQISKLLELGKRKGRVPMVRIFSKGAEQHAHRAMLIGLNGQKAIVKPQGHRRVEEIDLTSVSLWRAGNNFDLTEIDALSEPIQLGNAIEAISTPRFLIYNSDAKGYWHGNNRKWQASPMSALEYSNGAEATIFSQLVKQYGPFLRVVAIEEARCEWVGHQKKQYNTPITDERMELERQRASLLEKYGALRDALLEIDEKIRGLGGQKVIFTQPKEGALPTPPTIFSIMENVHIKKDVINLLRAQPCTIDDAHKQLLVKYPHCPLIKLQRCLWHMHKRGQVTKIGQKWTLSLYM
jgi:hypothetical protein